MKVKPGYRSGLLVLGTCSLWAALTFVVVSALPHTTEPWRLVVGRVIVVVYFGVPCFAAWRLAPNRRLLWAALAAVVMLLAGMVIAIAIAE